MTARRRTDAKARRLTDAELARRLQELAYRNLEVALDPEHPASRANGARWKRELAQVEAEARRRGLLAS